VIMTCFVDANHAGDKITRRSQTGFIIYVNNAPIDWFSKKQNTCESSTFGSEFVAMRIATERIKALRYSQGSVRRKLDSSGMGTHRDEYCGYIHKDAGYRTEEKFAIENICERRMMLYNGICAGMVPPDQQEVLTHYKFRFGG
jgi:hypothetical protein